MWKSGFKWMFLIIGTAIGAGYASGRELWQFFGYESGLAIILFSVLFTFSCAVVLNESRVLKTSDYQPLLRRVVGRKLTPIFDLMIFLYLCTITIVMIAGSGATGQAFNIPYWWGVGFLAIILVLLFVKGIHGIVAINGLLLPLLIGGLLFVLLIFMGDQEVSLFADWKSQGNWAAAFPFTALNILPMLAVLGAIGREVSSKGEVMIASIGSGLILGVISFIYNAGLMEIADEMLLYEIPLFAILQHYPVSMLIMMSILLWFAIFTTAASGILGIASRIKSRFDKPMWLIAAIALVLMIPLTSFGFSSLVKYTYPVYGVLNLYVLARLLIYPLWKNKGQEK